ncbi:MAG: flagellar motor switch protein FliG [Planctomycetota bacterium]|nr:MAG: flagellar motor switch protein FliG [Planctomycetota bacterium]
MVEQKIQGPTGIRKAAVLLLSLDQELAAKVMSQLTREEVEKVSIEIARLKDATKEERDKVLEEFYHLNVASRYVAQGGVAYARNLLEKSLPPRECEDILRVVEDSVQQVPFSFLRKAESENLLTFIQDEHPQTISLIISYLPPKKASEILAGLPARKQVEVVKRVANMEQTDPDVIIEVEKALQSRLSTLVTAELQDVGGVERLAEMLNWADRATEKNILENLEEEDPELVEQVRRLMFVFEDLILVNDKGIQAMLKEVDNHELALALKTASEELKGKIFNNMSERASSLIKEEMEYMGPVRISDVESAQQNIVDIVRRLEESGEAIIQGRGGEDGIVV